MSKEIIQDDDDDSMQLSEHTLAALREFYAEQTATEGPTRIHEDWQLSQFWYEDSTALMLAREALAVVKPSGRIACISCPTAYQKLRELDPTDRTIICLEYDERFSVFGTDFVRYDYNNPLNIPADFNKAFDIVLCDPPFLSEECLEKTAKTVQFMAAGAILLCTGAVMEELARKLLGVKVCRFHPKHANNLSNEFRCFTNYEPLVLNEM